MKGFLDLEEFNEGNEPSQLSWIYYFFLERGITINDLDDLPLPYIFEMMRTHTYLMKLSEDKNGK